MKSEEWPEMLRLLDENLERFLSLRPSLPVAEAAFWRDSPHRTLGHLTACQAAWIPLLRSIHEGKQTCTGQIHPNKLWLKLGYKDTLWETMLERFAAERAEWRQLLQKVDLKAQVRTPHRMINAMQLTERLVRHEKMHLDQLEES